MGHEIKVPVPFLCLSPFYVLIPCPLFIPLYLCRGFQQQLCPRDGPHLGPPRESHEHQLFHGGHNRADREAH